MSETPKIHSDEEISNIANKFLSGVTDLANELEIPPGPLMSLFGIFARIYVEGQVKNGAARDELTMKALSDYMEGLGLQSLIQRVDDKDEADEILAAIEEPRGTLQ